MFSLLKNHSQPRTMRSTLSTMINNHLKAMLVNRRINMVTDTITITKPVQASGNHSEQLAREETLHVLASTNFKSRLKIRRSEMMKLIRRSFYLMKTLKTTWKTVSMNKIVQPNSTNETANYTRKPPNKFQVWQRTNSAAKSRG